MEACVLLAYAITRPRFGRGAALLAALFLAITPIMVAVNRANNVDSALVLVLLLATWALLDAADTGRRSRSLLAMALVGVAFNTKMANRWLLPGTLAVAAAWQRFVQAIAYRAPNGAAPPCRAASRSTTFTRDSANENGAPLNGAPFSGRRRNQPGCSVAPASLA